MSKNIFIVFLLLAMVNCYGQQNADKHNLSLSIGAAIPIGNYADGDITNQLAGFAKTGQAVALSYVYRPGKHVGVSAMLYGQRNAIDTKGLGQEFSNAKIYQGFFIGSSLGQPIPPTSTTYPNWKFEKDKWLMGSLLVGIDGLFSLKHTNRLSLTGKALAGLIYVSSPELNGTSTTDTTVAHAEQNSSSAFGFSYLLRGGITYMLNSKISLLFSIDHLATNKIKFDDVKASFTSVKYSGGFPTAVSQSSATGSGKQNISTVNLSAGVVLRL